MVICTQFCGRLTSVPTLQLQVLVTGMHLSSHYGLSESEILKDGFLIGARVHALLASDTPEAISHSVGLGVQGFSRAYEQLKPDVSCCVRRSVSRCLRQRWRPCRFVYHWLTWAVERIQWASPLTSRIGPP